MIPVPAIWSSLQNRRDFVAYFRQIKAKTRRARRASLLLTEEREKITPARIPLWYAHRANPTMSDSLRRRANARNVSFRISLWWPIHIVNPVDKTKLSNSWSLTSTNYKKNAVETVCPERGTPGSWLKKCHIWAVSGSYQLKCQPSGNPSGITLNFPILLHQLVRSPQTLFSFCHELFFFVRARPPFLQSHPLVFGHFISKSSLVNTFACDLDELKTK